MDNSLPSQFLKLLRVLVLPKKSDTECAAEFTLNAVLKYNLDVALKLLSDPNYQKCVPLLMKSLSGSHISVEVAVYELESVLNNECGLDARWKYVMLTVTTMLALNESLAMDLERYNLLAQDMYNARPTEVSAPPMSPDTFSFEQKKTFLTSLQFVVCLAILPALHAGVGTPVERRTGFSALLQDKDKSADLPIKTREWRMLYCLKALLDLLNQPALATLILSRSFGDILAGLLQLCCASTHRQSKDSIEQDVATKVKAIGESDVASCEVALKKLLGKIYPPLIVRELLLLQGAPTSSIAKDGKVTLERSPAWLRRICGRLLSDIVIEPKGVQYVLKGLLHSAAEGSNAVANADWKRCESVAKVIAHCPRQSLSVDKYYKAVGAQLSNTKLPIV